MSLQNNTIMETNQKQWEPLFKAGGVAALIAVFIFRRFLSAELMAFHGFGIFAVPESVPVQAVDWFSLLQHNPLIGLALLDVFDLVELALVGLIYLSITIALRRSSPSEALIAAACGLAGIIVYFASNPAFGMLSLSERYTAAAGDAQRAAFLAAGEALLAAHNPWVLHQGTSYYAGLLLVYLAGLIFSVMMLRSGVFSKAAGVVGILANGFGLAYFPVLAFAPGLIVFPFVISAPFRVTWYFLISLKLFKLGKA